MITHLQSSYKCLQLGKADICEEKASDERKKKQLLIYWKHVSRYI